MNKIYKLLFSNYTTLILIIIFFMSMAVATFIENDYGTSTSKAVIYNTFWFELVMLLLMLNFIGNIVKYKLFTKKKISILLLHLSFIIIIIGAGISRYFGFEGTMPIREGSKVNYMYSYFPYFQLKVDDNVNQKYINKKLLINKLFGNKIEINDNFGIDKKNKIPYNIELVKTINNAKEIFVQDPNGEIFLQLISNNQGGRNEIYLKDGDYIKLNNKTIGFNNHNNNDINIITKDSNLFIISKYNGQYVQMQSNMNEQTAMQNMKIMNSDSLHKLLYKALYQIDDVNIVFKSELIGKITVSESKSKEEKEKNLLNYYYFDIECEGIKKNILVKGAENFTPSPSIVNVGKLNFILAIGPKINELPFYVGLIDFQLEKYSGTMSPSSFASEVRIEDVEKNKNFDYRIFMNNVLDYRGYRFFQSSYDPDENGTILSVNNDKPGTYITYLGYIIMGISMFWTLFSKGSRFQILVKKLNKIKNKTFLFGLFFTSMYVNINSQNDSLFVISKNHSEKFGSLLIQDHQGRIKPINTYSLELLRKIYKKDNYNGLSSEQVLLSSWISPKLWLNENIIKLNISHLPKDIKSKLNPVGNYTNLLDFYDDNNYILEEEIKRINSIPKTKHDGTDKEIISLDERVNVWFSVLNGYNLNIYPLLNSENNQWTNSSNYQNFTGIDTILISIHNSYINSLINDNKSGNYNESDKFLDIIKTYQKKTSPNIIPSNSKIELEIAYNKYNLFYKLLFIYFILGFLFLINEFVLLFNNNKISNIISNIFSLLSVVLLITHAVGLGVRWYISGHEPWSNGYEAVVFVSFITIVAGLLFSINRSKFTLSIAIIFSSFLLGIAHGSLMNPEITNLVPVLKSYWLMIHVAVITSSYGFLSLSSLLGLIVLIIYIIRNSNNRLKLNNLVNELTYINEMSMTIGLYLLAIGTFLGGVWANESWGRYWSWDPKEVWALISIMVYVFVLHIRLIPPLGGKFIFNSLSLFSISTLIMTFFGVNYFLSGMHSYATGDPVPIPMWIYITIIILIILTIFSYYRYKRSR